MLSGWLVATRHLPRNLAHVRTSHSEQGFSPGMRTVQPMFTEFQDLEMLHCCMLLQWCSPLKLLLIEALSHSG
jgi:hypothetical protein